MDSFPDDGPLTRLVQWADYLEQMVQERPEALFLPVAIIMYYVFIGTRVDTALLGLVLLPHLTNALAVLHYEYTQLAGTAPAATIAILAVALTVYRSLFNTNVAWSHTSQPYFIPSRTTHRRMFPKTHAFSYSYLTIGVPVGYRGRVNNLLTIDESAEKLSWWRRLVAFTPFTVDGEGYLSRGSNNRGLRGKLDEYLESEELNPSEYPHAYLVTAPKFLGYHFNPVSFWYLYSADKELSAVVLEVNNTFGERRPYIVFRDEAKQAETLQDPSVSRITADIAKDFHVSPFNSRKGMYSVLVKDPLNESLSRFRGLDVTIRLNSSKAHTKLVARLFDEGEAINILEVSSWQASVFIARWFWVGFWTYPRIVKEAAVLFFKRRLHVWYRPEPVETNLGRVATDNEIKLEAAFREYLGKTVESYDKAIQVRYIASGITNTEPVTFSSQARTTRGAETVELKVLTPAFYSRFIHYVDDARAFLDETNDSCTISLDNVSALADVFSNKTAPTAQTKTISGFLYMAAIRCLRQLPERIVRPLTTAKKEDYGAPLIQPSTASSMDAFFANDSTTLRKLYVSAAFKELIISRFFLGVPELLAAAQVTVKLVIARSAAHLIADPWKR